VKSTPITDTLVQLTRLGFVNAFLVREDDGLTLVDTTLGGNAPAIVAAAEAAGAPIVRIALTHAHGDHIGSLDALHAALPEAEVIVGAREYRLTEEDRRLEPGEPKAKVRGSWPAFETPPTRTVSEGDTVGSLRVVFAPGHTPGHVAYLDERDRTLIAGDAFSTKGGIAVAGKVRPLFPLVAMATWHRPTAVESARKLRALEPRRLAVGHGRALEDPGAAMDRAIAAASPT
jgi:glyoxylase-like metal-dependent hydrolase (beta-lactamase superfamily II)